MQLTLFTDYALRTLTYLALRPRENLATISEVSEVFGISRNHVVKIVHQLGVKGYVETVRGKHGGIRLGRPAAAINIRDVVVDMENILCATNCDPNGCRLYKGCRIQGIMRKGIKAFLDVLADYTLADTTKESDKLCGLLGIEPSNKERV